MTQPTVARSMQRTSPMQGSWDVRESCERFYWNRAGAESRQAAHAKFIKEPRHAAIAVSISERRFEAVRQKLRGMQRGGGIEYLGWTQASGESFVLLRLPDPVPSDLVGEILAIDGVLDVEPDRDRTADYYGFAPRISTLFDNACVPACPERTERIRSATFEQQDALSDLALPIIAPSPRHDPYVVAVIDDGVQWSHPYLGAHLWQNPKEMMGTCGKDDDGNGYLNDCMGWNFHANSSDPRPSWGWSHGTQSAGLIAAIANCADLDVRIMALRTQGKGSRLPLSGMLQALNYASTHGARTILLAQRWQLDGTDPGDAEKAAKFAEAIDLARYRGCLVVCAAGNGKEDIFEQRSEPAFSGLIKPHVLTAQGVGPGFTSTATASELADQLIVAPAGNNIRTIGVKQDRDMRFGATSAAAAIIAGVSAVVATCRNIADPADLKTCLLSCRDPQATDLLGRLIDLRYLT